MIESQKIKRVLFLCTGNSCRSQMAEGIVRHSMPDQIEAYSAGTEPTVINPRAIDVMSEIGIDISGLMSKSVDDLGELAFDLVITLCVDAQENCPYFPGETEVMHIGFEDPAKATGTEEEIRDIFRRVRDEIRDSIPALLRNRFDSGWRIGS